MLDLMKSLVRFGAVASVAGLAGLAGCASNGANHEVTASASDARTTVIPGWDQVGSPTWTANQGRAPTPGIAPAYVESPYALTGETEGVNGRADAADAWRQSNPRFGVGNAVILVPPPR